MSRNTLHRSNITQGEWVEHDLPQAVTDALYEIATSNTFELDRDKHTHEFRLSHDLERALKECWKAEPRKDDQAKMRAGCRRVLNGVDQRIYNRSRPHSRAKAVDMELMTADNFRFTEEYITKTVKCLTAFLDDWRERVKTYQWEHPSTYEALLSRAVSYATSKQATGFMYRLVKDTIGLPKKKWCKKFVKLDDNDNVVIASKTSEGELVPATIRSAKRSALAMDTLSILESIRDLAVAIRKLVRETRKFEFDAEDIEAADWLTGRAISFQIWSDLQKERIESYFVGAEHLLTLSKRTLSDPVVASLQALGRKSWNLREMLSSDELPESINALTQPAQVSDQWITDFQNAVASKARREKLLKQLTERTKKKVITNKSKSVETESLSLAEEEKDLPMINLDFFGSSRGAFEVLDEERLIEITEENSRKDTEEAERVRLSLERDRAMNAELEAKKQRREWGRRQKERRLAQQQRWREESAARLKWLAENSHEETPTWLDARQGTHLWGKGFNIPTLNLAKELEDGTKRAIERSKIMRQRREKESAIKGSTASGPDFDIDMELEDDVPAGPLVLFFPESERRKHMTQMESEFWDRSIRRQIRKQIRRQKSTKKATATDSGTQDPPGMSLDESGRELGHEVGAEIDSTAQEGVDDPKVERDPLALPASIEGYEPNAAAVTGLPEDETTHKWFNVPRGKAGEAQKMWVDWMESLPDEQYNDMTAWTLSEAMWSATQETKDRLYNLFYKEYTPPPSPRPLLPEIPPHLAFIITKDMLDEQVPRAPPPELTDNGDSAWPEFEGKDDDFSDGSGQVEVGGTKSSPEKTQEDSWSTAGTPVIYTPYGTTEAMPSVAQSQYPSSAPGSEFDPTGDDGQDQVFVTTSNGIVARRATSDPGDWASRAPGAEVILTPVTEGVFIWPDDISNGDREGELDVDVNVDVDPRAGRETKARAGAGVLRLPRSTDSTDNQSTSIDQWEEQRMDAMLDIAWPSMERGPMRVALTQRPRGYSDSHVDGTDPRYERGEDDDTDSGDEEAVESLDSVD